MVDGKPVLVIDRFDRDGDWRVGYVSAMTMLESRDGNHGSYLEVGAAIEQHSPRATDDLRELWRRIVFTVLISNTDDHLRNHGFLRTAGSGWTLAPAFDLNPDPRPGPKQLSTAIDETDATLDLDLALRVAPLFRLDVEQAAEIVEEVRAAIRGWRTVAGAVGIPEPEIERMAPAFSMSD